VKDRLLKIGSVVITVCLTVFILSRLTELMERKASTETYHDFFEQEEDFDILFAGTSHVINGILPMELWNNFGIVSYNLGGHDNRMATTYWSVMNALNYTTPKAIVVDCYFLSENTKTSTNNSYLHLSFDSFPLSVTKIKAVFDLYDDPVLTEKIESGEILYENSEQRIPLGLLWDYSVYHSRWDKIEERDFSIFSNYEKGATLKVEDITGLQYEKISSKMEGNTVSIKYLKKLVDECKKRNIEVILTYLPFPAREVYQEEANYLYDFAIDEGVDYINFLDMNLVDYSWDMADFDSHLNPQGALKVTNYLGRYLLDKLGNSLNRKDNADYSFWNEDYKACLNNRLSMMSEKDDFRSFLMMYRFNKCNGIIDIRNKDILNDSVFIHHLTDIGVEPDKLTNMVDFIIKCGDKDPILFSLNDIQDGLLMTDVGTISGNIADGQIDLYIDDKMCYSYIEEKADIIIGVFAEKMEAETDYYRFVSRRDVVSGQYSWNRIY